MLYKDSEQIKDFIKLLMTNEKVTYRELAERIGTSQQNLYKILNKNQLKFDDVKKVCDALGYKFFFNITKEIDSQEKDPFINALSALDMVDEMRMQLSKIKESSERMENKLKEYDNKKVDK